MARRPSSAASQQELLALRDEILSDRLKNEAADSLAAVGIPPDGLSRVRIIVVGPIGHGKSAFVNTVERAVFGRDEVVAATQGFSKEGTFYVDEYYDVSAPFSLLDTRGTTRDFSAEETTELEAMMNGTLRPGECLLRGTDKVTRLLKGEEFAARTKTLLEEDDVTVDEQVHAVVFVFLRHWVKLGKEKRHTAQVYQNMIAMRKYMGMKGYRPLALLTFMDQEKKFKRSTAESIEGVQELLGCSQDDIFCIANYTDHGQEASPDTEMVALQVIREAMGRSVDFIRGQVLQKQQSWRRSIQGKTFSQELINGTSKMFEALQSNKA